MSEMDDLFNQIPFDQLAEMLGANVEDVQDAASSAIPALLGGLNANAADPAGAASLIEALGEHSQDSFGAADIDTADGAKIVGNIFGDNTDQVMHQLGGVSSGSLVKKLLPLLAPIVMAWLSKRLQGGLGGGSSTSSSAPQDNGPLFPGGGGSSSTSAQAPAPQQQDTSASGGDPLQDILGQILGGALGGGSSAGSATSAGSGSSGGGILSDILGGLLGGGRR